ncbi:Protein ABHD13 [Halotydeus destructor]|nr:Protein ABHD13 [Halotydeus destructor]
MSFFTLRKCHVEAIKGLAKIVFFLLKKCWIQASSLLFIVLFLYILYGGLVAFLSVLIGVLAIMYKVGDWFLYHPEDPPDSRFNVASPSVLRLPYESAFVKTADGVTINVVLVKQEAPDKLTTAPTFVYLHGNAGNIGHRLQNVSELYHYLGCNVLLVEYRGYGLSKGLPCEHGLYLDSEAAMEYLLQHPAIDKTQIVLFGRSLGGGVAVELAKNIRYKDHVAAVIIENTFTSIPDIARILFDCKLVRMLPNWFHKNQFNSAAKMSKVPQATLFLSGLQDELIPPTMMYSLYQGSAAILKHFHEFEHGTHNFTWRCSDYYVVINSFLNKALKSSSGFARGFLNQQLIANQLLQVQQEQLAEQQQFPKSHQSTTTPNRNSPNRASSIARSEQLPSTPSAISLQYDSTPTMAVTSGRESVIKLDHQVIDII